MILDLFLKRSCFGDPQFFQKSSAKMVGFRPLTEEELEASTSSEVFVKLSPRPSPPSPTLTTSFPSPLKKVPDQFTPYAPPKNEVLSFQVLPGRVQGQSSPSSSSQIVDPLEGLTMESLGLVF